MNPEFFDEAVIHVARQLESCGLPYAMGGAVAYGYWGVPRATGDIDVNVFVPETRAPDVLGCLAAIGVVAAEPDPVARIARESQIRLKFRDIYVDIFFAFDKFHQICAERSREVSFGPARMIVLSAEDIVIFKILFNRTQDWADVERVVRVQGPALDRAYVRGWVVSFAGDDDVRAHRLDELFAAEPV